MLRDGRAADDDLKAAALSALSIPRERCRAFAKGATMTESCRSFLDNVSLAAL